MKTVILKCKNCNQEYIRYISELKRSKSSFCSMKCANTRTIEKQCIQCRNNFKIFQSEIKKCKSAGKYCSRKCGKKHRNISVECLTCKKQIIKQLSNIKRTKKQFCSKECCNNRTNPLEYFFNTITKENNCWMWSGRKDEDGYGIFYIRENVRAHRFSYEYHNKENAGEMLICHSCDNPSCVNPDHLWLGTARDNIQDHINKNRGHFKKLK